MRFDHLTGANVTRTASYLRSNRIMFQRAVCESRCRNTATPKAELFLTSVNSVQLLTVISKVSILDFNYRNTRSATGMCGMLYTYLVLLSLFWRVKPNLTSWGDFQTNRFQQKASTRKPQLSMAVTTVMLKGCFLLLCQILSEC